MVDSRLCRFDIFLSYILEQDYIRMNYVTKTFFHVMRTSCVSLLILMSFASCHGKEIEETEAYLSHFIADLWLEGADVLKVVWKDCSKKLVDVKDVIVYKEYFPKFSRCIKRKTLRALDKSLSTDVVPIVDGVNLVRFELVDASGNTLLINNSSPWTEKELEEEEWRTLALQRIAKTFHTHVIKFDFNDTNIFDKAENRGRRRHHLMTMMMFGIVSIGMVLVPMGFQFLAVLGGKALVLAKMALILASIQGLKKVDTNYEGYYDRGKIASSPLNYGFYHSYPFEHYDKRTIDNWPLLSIIQPALTSKDNTWLKSEESNSNMENKRDKITKEPSNITKRSIAVDWKPYNFKDTKPISEDKVFPVYPGNVPTVFTAVNVPSPIIDLTTIPGEVQADYALELPYNNMRFQSPTTVVPS
ncbi:uncharacterized protein Osi23 [Battus philenor]|uniref:uncharacterized protein Osi23 n=1 Tax=Battus philenor TaxID=42288 RepID=UPI0035CFE783